MAKSRRYEPEPIERRKTQTRKRQRLAVAHSLRSITDILDEDELDEWFDEYADDELMDTIEPIRRRR